MFAWAECSWTNRPQHSWTDRPQHSWTDRLPRKDAICHAASPRCWVHPNRDPAFNPPAKAGKLHSAFCSEEEGIPTSNGLFHNAPLGRSPHSPTPFSDRRGGSRRISPSCRSWCASQVSASIFDIGQGTLGLEHFSYGCKHTFKIRADRPGTHRGNGDWPYGRSSRR